MSSKERKFEAIVIGSGIGGLTAAAALAKCGRRVLVLEQHFLLGGLTQTFRRGEYTFEPGVHYIGGVGDGPGAENQIGRMLSWLTDGQLRFASIGSPYDIVRLPGFEFPVEAPRAAYIERLKATFPNEIATIDRYFKACDQAKKASMALFIAKGFPAPIAGLFLWLNSRRVKRALGMTTAEAVSEIRDKRLAALLTARWGDYGIAPAQSPFAVHALITEQYFPGAYYPIGGPAKFAETLAETITGAGGELRTRAAVEEIRVARGRVTGVRLASGELIDASLVISAMGAHNTAATLPNGIAPKWCDAIGTLKSSVSYVCLYLGFNKDIRQYGATPANVWVYESNDVGQVWERPLEEEAPAIFVSFPTLKDPAHSDPQHHTAEIMAICPWETFSAWASSAPTNRPKEYQAAKSLLADKLLAQFKRHFPQLAPLIDFYEVSTPLSQAAFVAADRGGMYGIEMSAERMKHSALRVRTPVAGLLLAGQDVMSLGVPGAFMGGFMAAASIEPRLQGVMRR